MPSEFRMPSLGPDMESGTLVAWQVKPGDTVKRGDIVALVETDKGVIDVEVFTAGTVEKLLVEPGAHVPVGTVLAQLSDGEPHAAAPAVPEPVIARQPVSAATIAAAPEGWPAAQKRQKISPAARARAHALGVDPAKVAGTGAGGVVTLEDINRQAAAPAAATTRVSAEQVHDMRRVIAKAMSRSKREIPHYYLSLDCCFSYEARTRTSQHAMQMWLKAIGSALQGLLQDRSSDCLVLVAAPRMLAQLRKSLPAPIRKRVASELALDLAQQPLADLKKRLQPALAAAARRMLRAQPVYRPVAIRSARAAPSRK